MYGRWSIPTGIRVGFGPAKIRKIFELIIDKTRELEDIVVSRYELDFS